MMLFGYTSVNWSLGLEMDFINHFLLLHPRKCASLWGEDQEILGHGEVPSLLFLS